MSDDIRPFRIDVPGADLDDLRDRLRRTRWPEPEPVGDWSQGTPLVYARELCVFPDRAARGSEEDLTPQEQAGS